MERILTHICEELNNWFTHDYIAGDFTITDGTIALPDLKEGQYFRINGSALNDGVYRYPAYGLQDETFRGFIGVMYIPPVVLDVAAELESAESAAAESGAGVLSPFSSESFNGYSYTRGTNKDGTPMTAMDAAWANALRKLRPWRKLP
jgi:hypothetical protein